MNHEEMLKEADRISKNEHEAWDCAYDLLRRKEREELNHIKVYECQDTLSWYICNFDSSGDSVCYPFGFFFADYLNFLLSLESKESFIAFERRMRSGAASKKEINPLYDKKGFFDILPYDEYFKGSDFKIDASTTDKEYEDIYNNVCWLWEYVKDDVKHISAIIKYMKDNAISNNDIRSTYRYVQRMVMQIWHRQINSSCYNKNGEDYNSNDEYTRITDESIAELEEDSKEIISPEWVIENFVVGFRYTGYENVKFDNDTESFCRIYDVGSLLHLVAEDMIRFMLHQTTHNFDICPECGRVFVTTHGNQKHCPACNLIIRQKKRKQNPARYLHKNITDYINNYRNDGMENASEAFRNESNYYWDIVQGKAPENVGGYSAKIKTEADYIKWLEKKYEEIKAQK